jgi:hypothetical protein
MEENVVRPGRVSRLPHSIERYPRPPLGLGALEHRTQLKAESADYDLSAISVAAKPRIAIVIKITVLAGIFLRNSVISFLRCSSQRQKNSTIGINFSVSKK